METWPKILRSFLKQSHFKDLKTSSYPKEWQDLRMKVSFGMGTPARISWIAFTAPEMQVSRGFYPVYLYYKELQTLVLAYGVSETEEFEKTWPVEIMNSAQTINAYFDSDVPRYGDSFVFKAYKVTWTKKDYTVITSSEDGSLGTEKELEQDLNTILEYYKKTVSLSSSSSSPSTWSQGIFYMEKQLEDFIIHNWKNTELGKRFDLIIEEGELVSQQYKTDIGPIDILAKDKKEKNHVVIELKKNQTSDDTVGQLARYMGWIRDKKNDKKVKGIIIAAEYDRRLDYALKVFPNVEVFLYEVNFKLNKFSK